MMSLKQFLGTPFAEAEALSADLRWSHFAKGPGDENLPEASHIAPIPTPIVLRICGKLMGVISGCPWKQSSNSVAFRVLHL